MVLGIVYYMFCKSQTSISSTSLFCKDGGLSLFLQVLLTLFSGLLSAYRQSVPRSSAQEYVPTRAGVGHGSGMRGCNATTPSTEFVEGVDVGHFGE